MKSEPREMMRADPIARRRALIGAVIAMMLAAAALAFIVRYGDPIEAWRSAHLRRIDELLKVDPAAGRASIVRTGWILLVVLWSLGAVFFAGCIWFARTLRRAEQWPPSDARLIADVRIIRGKSLRVMSAVLLAAGALAFCTITYAAWRLAGMLPTSP